jgi:hypothetical protein
MNMKRWAIALFCAVAIAVMAAPAHADTVVKVPNAPGTFDATVAGGIISADRPAHPALPQVWQYCIWMPWGPVCTEMCGIATPCP